jgi:DNA-binding response OmpR family regulator
MKPALVLIVEDDRTTQELARLVLEGAGYDVRTVESAEQASAHFDAVMPDVVLMDRELPGMDGLELTRQLKSNERTSGAIVLAFTSRTTPADDALAIEAGSDGFVHKPFDVAGLLRTIGWHVSTRAARTGKSPVATPSDAADAAPSPDRPALVDRSSPDDVARDTLSVLRMSAILQALKGDTMKIARTVLCTATLIASVAAVSAAQNTAAQTFNVSVAAINQLSVSGNPLPLSVTTAVAGSNLSTAVNTATTWAVTTNQSGAIVSAAITSGGVLPTGVTLSAMLTAPTASGASTGLKALGTSGVNLVTGLGKVYQSGMTVEYDLTADISAGVVAPTARTITFTLAGGT